MYKSALVFLSLALTALAVDTRYWSQDAQSDFEKGNLKKVKHFFLNHQEVLLLLYFSFLIQYVL